MGRGREGLNFHGKKRGKKSLWLYLVPPVPEDEGRRLRTVRYDAGEVDQAPLCKKKKKCQFPK